MKYWLEYEVKTKTWKIYKTKTKYEGETMLCVKILSVKLFDRIIEGILKIVGNE